MLLPNKEEFYTTMLRSITLSAPLFLLLTAALVSHSIGGDTLTPGRSLADDGSTLISAHDRFALGFFSPGEASQNRYVGIWYHGIADGETVVWVANRQSPVVGRSGRLSLASNGTLVITDGNSTVMWSSSLPAVANPVAQLLDDGNFVVIESGSGSSGRTTPGWQSFDFPTDTLLQGMLWGWNLTSRANHNLTAWKSASDPAPSGYVSGIDLHGIPQLCIWLGTKMIWRGGPWNGERFIGVEGMKRDPGLGIQLKFVWNATQVFFWLYSLNPSVVNRAVMNSSGILGNLLWIDEKKTWAYVGFEPRDECDSISRCGPYGVCRADGSSLCGCLQGFVPWNHHDGSDGCVRKTALDCRKGTDGFAVQSNVKLPDTASSTVDWSASLEQCRDRCLKNCSCTAYARANISDGGSGCIIWTTELTDIKLQSGSEQDLYVRLAAADLESIHSRRRHGVIIIVLPLVLAIFLLSGVAYCVWRRKKSVEETQGEGEEDFDLPLYNLATIEEATDNFSIENKLGQGGFGPVYKGKLREGQEIAVKRLSTTSTQGVDEFKNEVLLIAKLQHRNLVRLLGCCIQGGERMLIYEYMPNGSLDSYLFDGAKSVLLDWPARFNIIVGIARALLYLHHDSRLTIIHRDLKASNVLLDKDMNPKISDFGLARILGGDDTEVNTRRVVGTYGYMSPEYALNGIFSIKSDVFSFGVLVLEIITGKRTKGELHLLNQNLIEYIWRMWKEDKALEVVDKTIGQSLCEEEFLSCMKIGLLCIQEIPSDRPTMHSVEKMLGNDSILLPEPKEPSLFTLLSSSEATQSTSRNLMSVNDISTIVLEGR